MSLSVNVKFNLTKLLEPSIWAILSVLCAYSGSNDNRCNRGTPAYSVFKAILIFSIMHAESLYGHGDSPGTSDGSRTTAFPFSTTISTTAGFLTGIKMSSVEIGTMLSNFRTGPFKRVAAATMGVSGDSTTSLASDTLTSNSTSDVSGIFVSLTGFLTTVDVDDDEDNNDDADFNGVSI